MTVTCRPRCSNPFAARRTQYSVTTPNTRNSASRGRLSTSAAACWLSKMSSVCFSRRICWVMEAAMRNQEAASSAGRVGEFLNVGQKLFRARNVQLATRQHEVLLRIDFPQDEIVSDHASPTSIAQSRHGFTACGKTRDL